MISIQNILRRVLMLAVMLSVTCFGQTQTDFERECTKLAKARGKDTERLHKLFKLDWEHTMVESPEFATEVGFPGQNHRWTDNSLEAIARRKRELQSPLKVIKSINRNKLSAADQLSYDLFRKNYELAVEGIRFPAVYFQITQLSGVQQDLARYMELSPDATVKDYEDLI